MSDDLPEADEAYALTSGGSLRPETFRICISRKLSLITMECNSGPILEPATKITPVSLADWEELKQALQTASFWAMPEWQCFHGLDGWFWEISGKDSARMHVSACWCPDRTNKVFYDLGLSFIKLSGAKNPAAAWRKFLSRQPGP